MSIRATISIDGFDLPEPSVYDATTSTLVDSARNVEGYVVGSVVREDLAKVALKWNLLTGAQWSSILKLFESKYGGNFFCEVTFLNQVTDDWETRTMYVSDRKAGLYMRDVETGLRQYTGASLSLVEK